MTAVGNDQLENGEPLEAALRRVFFAEVEPKLSASWDPGSVAGDLHARFPWNEKYSAEAERAACYAVTTAIGRKKTPTGRTWVVTRNGQRKKANQMVLDDFDVMIDLHREQEEKNALERRFWTQLRGAFLLRCAERGLDPATTERKQVLTDAEVKTIRKAA